MSRLEDALNRPGVIGTYWLGKVDHMPLAADVYKMNPDDPDTLLWYVLQQMPCLSFQPHVVATGQELTLAQVVAALAPFGVSAELIWKVDLPQARVSAAPLTVAPGSKKRTASEAG
jgi:hypothetical protein